jgi:hypothetical protein
MPTMSRLSLSNLLLPVSREEFTALTTQFKQAAEHSFGGPCKLEIHAMDAVKSTSSFMHDDWIMEAMAEDNKRRTFFETDDPAKLTADVWNKAAYVEVSVKPVNEKDAPASAWGHAEFKGYLPRQATFYLQPDDGDAMKSMRSQNPYKRAGDGYRSNTGP